MGFQHNLRQFRHRAYRRVGQSHLYELEQNPGQAPQTVTSRRVNHLLNLSSGDTYLEIGVANGETLQAVTASQRIAVDPCPVFAVNTLPPNCYLHPVPSDDFFASLPANWRTDAILVDGLHEFRQTYRDLLCSLAHLNPRGFVLVDDTVPPDTIAAMPDQDMAIRLSREAGLRGPRPWMGDVYKVIRALHEFHPELEYFTMTGDERPQTVVWPRHPTAPPTFQTHRISEIESLAYESDWTNELPGWFRPMSDSGVFEQFELHLLALEQAE